MKRDVVERLAETLMAMPEGEREALLASLTVKREPSGPSPQGPHRELPAPRAAAAISCVIEWV
ncbi:hypothetical protein KGG99_gp49 [Streptomyces phage Werner]|uniref:Uncharacterized protein n=1 Tax=Streptomyces phage Werner TaxID=2801898 RepID=A0A7U0GCW4_9CAUD|nr:hypothetical protein KGG99_gp49 [Streptomyces phage Werner]QQO39664.1 hypothetical protein SEA_HIPPO_49 [Streptomyces phage Hippo]QQV92870.1 hypothetical protein SEA_WERNER_49 [Streptomyces phage Werner]